MFPKIKKSIFTAALISVGIATFVLTQPTPKVYYATVTKKSATDSSITIDGDNIKDATGKIVNLNAKDTIKVRAGKYTGMTVKNIKIDDGYVNIVNENGAVEIVGSMQYAYNVCGINNLQGVNITGNGVSGIKNGFVFRDNKYRFISVGSTLRNVTIQYAKFSNIHDYTISFDGTAIEYNSTDSKTYSENIKFSNLEIVDCSTFSLGGGVNDGKVIGVIRNLEINNCNIHDCPGTGTVFWAGAVDGYNIHDNYLNNLNAQNNNHNGIFVMCGVGKLYNNQCFNHQGNLIRAWLYTIGISPKTTEIYNNIVVNSRKYSGFEVQGYAYMISPGKTTFANAKVYKNTCGQLNTSNDWAAAVLDVYNILGGSVEVYNNLAFDIKGIYIDGTNGMNNVCNIQAYQPVNQHDNIYKFTWQEAVTDITTFTSKIPGVGAKKGDTTAPVNQNPADTATTQNNPTIPSKRDTVWMRDTLYIAGKKDTVYTLGKAVGKYTLTVTTDNITLKKQ